MLTLTTSRAQQTINYNNGDNKSSPIILTSGTNPTTLTISSGNATQSGTISESGGSFGITKAGNGTLILSGTNTYSGVTSITSGILNVNLLADSGVSSSIGSGSQINLGSYGQLATLQMSTTFSGNNETNRSIVLAAGSAAGIDVSNTTSSTGTSTIFMPAGDLYGATVTLNGSISGAGTLVKLGSANLDLRGTNTYTGGTVVEQGILRFGTAGSVSPTGSITVISGGTVGTGYSIDQTFLNQVTSSSSGVVALGADSGNNLDFSNLPNVALGALGHYIFAGSLSPNMTAGYQLGGGGVNVVYGNTGPDSVLYIVQADTITGNHNVTVSPHGTAGAAVVFDDTENFVGALNVSGAINAAAVSPSSFPSSGNLTSNNQAAWTAFGQLFLAGGSAGTLPGVTAINLNPLGILEMIATPQPTDRLPDSTPINFYGGILGFLNDSDTGSNASYSETVGQMNVLTGASEVFTNTASSGHTSVLTFSGLNRAAGATMTFAGNNLGTTQNQVVIDSAGLSTTSATPWAFIVNNGASTIGSGDVANDFALFSSSGTITAANGVSVTSSGTFAAGGDYTISGTTVTALGGTLMPFSTSRTANTIRDTYGAFTIDIQSNRILAVNGLMTATSPNASYQFTIGRAVNSGTLTSANTTTGATPRELILNSSSVNGTGTATLGITVNSAITDNAGGSVTVVKAGDSNLTLNATHNSFSGGLIVNGLGSVISSNIGALGTGTITLNSGSIQVNGLLANANVTNGWVVNNDAVLLNGSNANNVKFSGSIALNGGTLYYISSNNQVESLTGTVSGTGGLTLEGAGSNPIIIGGASNNTYTGLTSITGRQDGAAQTTVSLEKTGTATAISGNILLGVSTSSGTGTNQVQEILVLNNGNVSGYSSNQIADSSVITFQGGNGNDAGVFRMLGQSETIGGIQSSSPNDGIIQNNSNLAGNVSTLTVNVSGTNSYTYSGVIQDHDSSNSNVGKLAITKAGNGTLILSGNNTFSGGLVVNGYGAVVAQASSSLGSGVITLNSGVVELGDAMAANSNITNNWVVNNDAVIANSGPAAGIRLSGNIALNGGTLFYLTNANVAQSLNGVISGSGDFSLKGAGANPIIIGGASSNTYTGATAIGSFPGGSTQTVVSLEKTGTASAISGNILLGQSSFISAQAILVLNNSLSGTTVASNENEIADSSVITFQGGNGNTAGVLRMLGQSETIGGIQSSTTGDGIIQNNSNLAGNVSTLTLNVSGTTNYTYAGLIQDHDSSNSNVGKMAIIKTGSGTQTFTNTSTSNTYSGGTTINQGTLLANGTGATGTGNVIVNSGATLGGAGTITPASGNSITVASGGWISPGGAPSGSAAQGYLSVTAPSAVVPALIFSAPSGATLNTPQLSFNLGSGAAPSDSSGLTFAGSSSYIGLTVDIPGEVRFNNNLVQLNDLTNGYLGIDGDYLLFQGRSNSDYSGLTVDSNGLITAGLYIFGPSSVGVSQLYVKNGDIYVETNITEPAPTDTPTMPQWGLVIMASLLMYVCTRERKSCAS